MLCLLLGKPISWSPVNISSNLLYTWFTLCDVVILVQLTSLFFYIFTIQTAPSDKSLSSLESVWDDSWARKTREWSGTSTFKILIAILKSIMGFVLIWSNKVALFWDIPVGLVTKNLGSPRYYQKCMWQWAVKKFKACGCKKQKVKDRPNFGPPLAEEKGELENLT